MIISEQGGGGRRLIRRPMETPGLELNPNPQQAYPAMTRSQYLEMLPGDAIPPQFPPGEII